MEVQTVRRLPAHACAQDSATDSGPPMLRAECAVNWGLQSPAVGFYKVESGDLRDVHIAELFLLRFAQRGSMPTMV